MTDIDSTIRQIRVARVRTMSKVEKVSYLKSNGWQRADGNRWRHRSGAYATFAAAVETQILADLGESP
jgi:hypothetical protein